MMHPVSFPNDQTIAEMTARMLIEIQAVNFRIDEPFVFTSGVASPVYVDCRKLISYPRIRTALMDFCAAKILRNAGFEKFDAIAGGETAGIAFAAWLADRLGLPMLYVRKKAKGFGRNAQIEGDFREGDRVLLMEDLTTDGGSKITFCKALRHAGAKVSDTLVIFSHGIFPDTAQRLGAHDLRLHHLASWQDVVAVCRQEKTFDVAVLREVEAFLNAPLEWSRAHGGAAELPDAQTDAQTDANTSAPI